MASFIDRIKGALGGIKDPFNQPNPNSYLVSSALPVLTLCLIGAVLYPFTHGIGTIVALVLALLVIVIRQYVQAKAREQFVELHTARKGYRASREEGYLEFIELQGANLGRAKAILTEPRRAELAELLEFAEKQRARRKRRG